MLRGFAKIMSGGTTGTQRSITAFFSKKSTGTTSSPSVKLRLPSEKEANLENQSPNKIVSGGNSDCQTPEKMAMKRKSEGDSSELTPDQKKRIMENKVKCEVIQQSKKTPALNRNIGLSWFQALKPEFSKPGFLKLSTFLQTERSKLVIFPPEEDVWSWTHHFDVRDTKVVILGQDPYHGPRQAHGLCFSVQKGVMPPPSLVNIFKELETDIPGFKKPNHGDLTGWAKQGVLLLNACLSVRQGQANSHKDQGWEAITDAVIKYISDNCNGVVFLLWGSFAQKKAAHVNSKKHFLLKSVHPSPLSAHRGFFGCHHFSKCNELLRKNNKKHIDWNDLP